MNDVVVRLLTSFGFGVGLSSVLLGLALLYQIFIKGIQFNSQALIVSISTALLTLGSSLLFFIFV